MKKAGRGGRRGGQGPGSRGGSARWLLDPGEHSGSGNLEPTRASARGPGGRQALGPDPGCQGRGCCGQSRAQPGSFRTPPGPGRPIPGPLSMFQEEGAVTLLETHRPEGAHLGRGERGDTVLVVRAGQAWPGALADSDPGSAASRPPAFCCSHVSHSRARRPRSLLGPAALVL